MPERRTRVSMTLSMSEEGGVKSEMGLLGDFKYSPRRFNLSASADWLMSPPKTRILHRLSAGMPSLRCMGFASAMRVKGVLGSRRPTTTFFASSCLLVAADVMTESSYCAVIPAV